MMRNITNNKLSETLNNVFECNIKLSFVSELSVIIVTTNDKCYEFDRKNNNSLFIALSDDKKKIETFKKKSYIAELSDKQIIEIKSGRTHLIGRTSEGQVHVWSHHGLKDISKESVSVKKYKPELIQIPNDEKVEDMCCGCDHALVLTNNGVVYALGRNHYGQIGNNWSQSINHNEYQSKPFTLNAFLNLRIKSISCGSYHSMALTEDGHVYSWGCNYCGQLGIGNESNFSSPKLLKISNVSSIERVSCGKYHSLLLTSEKDIYVCGWNWSTELKPCHWIISTPIRLNHSEKFTDITSFFDDTFSAAISDQSVIYIWGKCGKDVITQPKRTKLKSFEDIYNHYLRKTYKSISGKVILFNDDFTQNGLYGKNFDDEKFIGGGSYGKVFRVNEKSSKKSYAIKMIKFEFQKRKEFCGELETSFYISEMRSDKVIKYYNVWLEKYKKNLTLFIQMEICDKSLKDFFSLIQNDLNFFSTDILTSLGYYISIGIFIEILEGVKYLHEYKPIIIHRDLCSMNIMLKIGNKPNAFVKIVDLGLAAIHKVKSEDQSHSSLRSVTREHKAPEVKSGNYNEKCDIYSLGLVLRDLFVINVNRTYKITDENDSEYKFRGKYQVLSNLCDKMIQNKIDERPDSIKKILEDQDLWNLDIDEFKIEKLKEICKSNTTNDAFVYKLLENKLSVPD